MLTYYQKELIFFFFFLPLQFRGANVQGGEGPLAEAQGGQLGRQEEPLTVQAKTEPLLIRSKLFIDQDLVSPPFSGQGTQTPGTKRMSPSTTIFAICGYRGHQDVHCPLTHKRSILMPIVAARVVCLQSNDPVLEQEQWIRSTGVRGRHLRVE